MLVPLWVIFHVPVQPFSEVVLPVWNKAGALLAVLDIDSDQPDAFTQTDADALVKILALVFSR